MSDLVDGAGLAEEFLRWVKAEVSALPKKPGLAAVLAKSAGTDSKRYRDLILKDAAALGIKTKSVEPEDEKELLSCIKDLNRDPGLQGIVVLYPLRMGKVPDDRIMDLIEPMKDIEGLHSINLGYLIKYRRFLDERQGAKCVVPATAKAVVKALQHHRVPIEGAFAVIVNNSMRVGKPLGLMLENLGATVVKCYDKTRAQDLEDCVRKADIVVTAVPDPKFRLDPSWIKAGAAVIDLSNDGNADLDALKSKAGLLGSPKHGIGKVTRAMMLVNLVYCSHPQAREGRAVQA